uniref:Transmembrane protein n=1 Tax=Panagrellus redivivus TaxID=6233 RepID=A0A7E4VYK2_PANRE
MGESKGKEEAAMLAIQTEQDDKKRRNKNADNPTKRGATAPHARNARALWSATHVAMLCTGPTDPTMMMIVHAQGAGWMVAIGRCRGSRRPERISGTLSGFKFWNYIFKTIYQTKNNFNAIKVTISLVSTNLFNLFSFTKKPDNLSTYKTSSTRFIQDGCDTRE